MPQYYVEHSHEAIIDPEEWRAVLNEIARRKRMGRKYSGASVLASRLICADCGDFYGTKVWHSNSKYRRVIQNFETLKKNYVGVPYKMAFPD